MQHLKETVKENYTWRIWSDLKDELSQLAAAESELSGRRATLAHILERCVRAGKPIVEREIRMDFAVPHSASTEKEKVLAVTIQAVERGLDLLRAAGQSA